MATQIFTKSEVIEAINAVDSKIKINKQLALEKIAEAEGYKWHLNAIEKLQASKAKLEQLLAEME